jgi:hypothetical protein
MTLASEKATTLPVSPRSESHPASPLISSLPLLLAMIRCCIFISSLNLLGASRSVLPIHSIHTVLSSDLRPRSQDSLFFRILPYLIVRPAMCDQRNAFSSFNLFSRHSNAPRNITPTYCRRTEPSGRDPDPDLRFP